MAIKPSIFWSVAGVGGGLTVLVAVIVAFGIRRETPQPKRPVPTPVPVVVAAPQPKPVEPKVVEPTPKPKPIAVKPKAKGASDEDIARLVSRINEYRKLAGLSAVTVDHNLSLGCRRHVEYCLARLAEKKHALAELQDEDPALKGFTEEGRAAAKASLIATLDPAAALPFWLGRVPTRLPLLHPDLERIGVFAGHEGNDANIIVVDVLHGRAVRSVCFPADGQENIPLSSSGGPEAGDADVGFPVSLQFPTDVKVDGVDAYLADERGNRLNTLLSTPESPLPGVRRPGLIGMIPERPLAPKFTYKAHVEANVDGRPFKKEWTFTTQDDGDDFVEQAAKMRDRLNDIRKQAGLEPVELEDVSSAACRAHARYLVLNARRPEAQGLGVHREDPKLPGYTPLGEKAAKASDISIGDPEPIDALDGWMATLYHRVPLLDSGLKTIGFGCARGNRLGWVTVLDVGSGREEPTRRAPIVWPADSQADVPLHFPPGGEIPDPIPKDKSGRAGYPITATFPKKASLQNSAMSLQRDNGTSVPCWFSSPESPANPKVDQRSTVCLIPKAPLLPGERYRVVLTARLGDEPLKKNWTFTTGKGALNSAEAVKLAVERFNLGRETAGLPAVTLDKELSQACQAHADFLVRNSARRGDPKFSANDESPGDPGFTPQGQAAAKRSDVFSLAPSPTTQIDDLFGSLQRRSFALDPRLRRIGLGCAHEVGVGWFNVLDLSSGRDEFKPIIYPTDGQKEVPTRGGERASSDEKPSTGFPITVWFPGASVVAKVRATLAEKGRNVDVRIHSTEQPLDRNLPQPNLIVIVPREPLSVGRTYSLTISAEVNGVEWNTKLSFQTSSESP